MTLVQIEPYDATPAGAFADIQYTPRLELGMPGYANLALIEQLNSNMVTLDRALLVDEATGEVASGLTLDHAILVQPAIADFTLAQHDHLDADDGGALSGNAVQTEVTGTGFVVKQAGATLTAPALTGPALTDPVANGLGLDAPLGTIRRLDWRTAGLQRWAWLAQGGAEGGGDQGSDLVLYYYADAGTQKGEAIHLRRTDGRVSFPHDVVVSGALTVAGAVSMPALDVSAQVNAGIDAHEAEANPHGAYLTQPEGVALFAPVAHVTDPTAHSQFLTQQEADPLYLGVLWGAQHLAAGDPHPSYLTQTESDQVYAPLSHTTAPNPHPQYQPAAAGTALEARVTALENAATVDADVRLYVQQIMTVLDPDGPPSPFP